VNFTPGKINFKATWTITEDIQTEERNQCQI